jgi:hypothetical protein
MPPAFSARSLFPTFGAVVFSPALHQSLTTEVRHRHTIRTMDPTVPQRFKLPSLSASSFLRKNTTAVRLRLAARLSFVRNPRGVKRAIAMLRSVSARPKNCDFDRSTSRPLAGGLNCGCNLLPCYGSRSMADDRLCASSLMTLLLMTTMLV